MSDSSLSASPLRAATEAALAAHPQHRTVLVVHEGKRYIAKRLAEKPRRLMQTLFMRWLVKRITGQPLPMRTLALSESASSMDYEGRRLTALAAAGVPVAPLILQTQSYLLLADCGTVVASQLENWTAEIWRPQLLRMADDLARFHAAGHWHGGAQIKNVTLQDDQFTRIDFEENFGEFLPLPVSQANDLILFINSISLAGPLDEAESRQLLPRLLAAYFTTYPSPEVRQVLQKAYPWLRGIARLGSPLVRFSRKGLRRNSLLVEALATHLSTQATTPLART